MHGTWQLPPSSTPNTTRRQQQNDEQCTKAGGRPPEPRIPGGRPSAAAMQAPHTHTTPSCTLGSAQCGEVTATAAAAAAPVAD